MTNIAKADNFMASLGVECYRVGGSVRDEIVGRPTKDADYMVRGVDLDSLRDRLVQAVAPPRVRRLTLRDGQHVGYRVGGMEIVLPRTDVSTGPGHGDFMIVVDPALSLNEDARRRDFTFNTLYKRIGGRIGVDDMVIDPTGWGILDIQRRMVRITHPDSFRDDPLRTLRALRFVSTLGYDLEAQTRASMMLHAESVTGLTTAPRTVEKFGGTKISYPGGMSGTVLDELSRILMGADVAKALRLARDTGVLAVLLPELAAMLGFEQGSRYHDLTTDEHVFTALETAAHVDAPLRVRMALLFHDAGKPASAWVGPDGRTHYYEPSDKVWYGTPQMAGLGDDGINQYEKPQDHEVEGERLWREAANRMNTSKELRDDVSVLIRNHMVPAKKVNLTKVRRARIALGDDLLRDLYLMRMCDLSGKGNKNMPMLVVVAQLEKAREEAQNAGEPRSVKDLLIDGRDVIAAGAKGPQIGKILAAVLDEVAVDPTGDKLTRDWQLKAVARHG